MLRIAHVSDFHFEVPSVREPGPSISQRIAEVIGATLFHQEVRAEGHSEEKLAALRNSLSSLRPDVIVVTGDLTNFGDEASFSGVAKIIEDLRAHSGADRVLCVPGNHDSLTERAAFLGQSRPRRMLRKALSKFVREVDIPARQADKLRQEIAARPGLAFLGLYEKIIDAAYGPVDASRPCVLDAGWGNVLFFLFNSNNDPILMANEGNIGSAQYNALNSYLGDASNSSTARGAARIALLHHHPISAPDAEGSATIRGFNWMIDGPRLLEHLNRCKFHFVLHGHEHVPFTCTVSYSGVTDSGLHILAAGSATQGSAPHKGSFNIIDLVSPFEASFRRYDYAPTGFEEARHHRRHFPIRDLNRLRISDPDRPEMSEDIAVRTLFRSQPKEIDETHRYELLGFDVEITADQVYKAAYRRRGTVNSVEPDPGPTFVITGDPKANLRDMQLGAYDNASDQSLKYEVLRDDPTQKVIRVLHALEKHDGDPFDVTLRFVWAATSDAPHDFDGFNLTSFRYPIGKMKYRVVLPHQPAQPKVRAYGIEMSSPMLISNLQDRNDGTWEYSFEIENPKPLGYLIHIQP